MSNQKTIYKATVIAVEENDVTVNYNVDNEITVPADGQLYIDLINKLNAVYLIEEQVNNIIGYSVDPRHSGTIIRRTSNNSVIVEFDDHGVVRNEGVRCTDHNERDYIYFTYGICDCQAR